MSPCVFSNSTTEKKLHGIPSFCLFSLTDSLDLNAEEKAALIASTKSPISFLSKLGQSISRKRTPKVTRHSPGNSCVWQAAVRAVVLKMHVFMCSPAPGVGQHITFITAKLHLWCVLAVVHFSLKTVTLW